MVLRASVARSASSEWKLCTGRPSSVSPVVCFFIAAFERCACATTLRRCASAASLSVSSNSIGASFWRICHSRYSPLGQDPKLLGRDDTEVIRYLITIGVPFSGHLLAQKGQDFGFEVSKCRMTSIVGDMLVHQPP